VPIDIDVVIDIDAAALEGSHLIGQGGQRLQNRSVESLEPFAAVARQFLEGAAIEVFEQFGDGDIDLVQAEETPVAQAGQNPAFDDLDAHFNLGLVLRLSRSRRENYRPVMGCEIQRGPVGPRLVAVRLEDQRFGIVGYDQID
jgi:hypothetical protein